METATANSILVSLLCVLAVAGLVKVVNWIWLRPKKLEKLLRQQGIPGTSYRLLFGDLKDVASLRAQAMTKPMSSFSHDSLARIDPFRHQLMTKFGMSSQVDLFLKFCPYFLSLAVFVRNLDSVHKISYCVSVI